MNNRTESYNPDEELKEMPRETAGQEERPADIEERLSELEGMLQRLESGELGLTESLAVYGRAVSLIRKTEKELQDAEKKLQILTEDGNLHDF